MKISSQVHWLSIALVLTTAALIGIVVFTGFSKVARQQQYQSAEKILDSITTGIKSDIQMLEQHTRLISLLPSLQDARTNQVSREELVGIFRELLQTNPYVFQVRFIGMADAGKEILRLEQENNIITRTPEELLQAKGNRNYFAQTLAAPNNSVVFSEVNLNREFREIQTPHKPTIRLSRKVLNSNGEPIGIVVVNANFQNLIDIYWDGSFENYDFIVANPDGQYLVNPDANRTFGFEFGKKYLVQDDFPAAKDYLSQAKIDGESVVFQDGSHFFQTTSFSETNKRNFLLMGLLLHENANSSYVVEAMTSALGTTAVLVCLAMVAGYFASNFLTRPLSQITNAARELERGHSPPDLPVNRNDEIGVLARTFDQMSTNLRRKQVELTETNHRLITANNDLEHFTHLAAHDLREPLRKQVNLIQLFTAEQPDLNPDAAFLFSKIQECNERMSQMVTDFRMMTRVAEDTLMRTPIDFDTLINQCLEAESELLKLRNVHIIRDQFPKTVEGYPSLLKLLYENLISNAIAHVPVDKFDLHFTAKVENHRWVFGVRNTGSTIPKSQLQNIFKMFRTVDMLRENSTGVGLSLCKRIVDKHAGTITAESGPDFTHILFTLEC